MNISSNQIWAVVAVAVFCVSALPKAAAQSRPAVEPGTVQLMALANEARAAAGAAPLRWDNALAEAARKHCLRMAAEGPIAHRYPGELDLSERAGLAGAHFDLVEENVAIGPTPVIIHDEWMHSMGHRENILNPEVDRVGIAVIASRGVLYATADYAHGVQALSQTEIEKHVAELIKPSWGGDWREHTSCARCLHDGERRTSVVRIDAAAICDALAGLGPEPFAEATGR